jgi:Domain of unknown function (DUF4411)
VLYLLDANVLIQAHEDYYPMDRVPQFWDWLLSNAENGLIKMPVEIHGEIAIADGLLATWISAEATKKVLLLDEEVDQDTVAKVLAEGYGADLTDNDLEKIGNDAFLIAYALANGERTVVTKETSRPTAQKGNRKVPDVCDHFKVKWIRDFQLYKTLNFTTK